MIDTLTPGLIAVPTVTATADVLPAEPQWMLVMEENFDASDLSAWLFGAGWTLEPQELGYALQVFNSNEAASLSGVALTDTAAEVRFQPGRYPVRLAIRQSAAGSYMAELAPDGLLKLYRGPAPLAALPIAPVNEEDWVVVRLSAVEDIVRVSVNGMPAIALRDPAPLPAGTVVLAANFTELREDIQPPENTVRVDDFTLWQPAAESPTATMTASPAATETVTLSPTPEPSATSEATDSGMEITAIIEPTATDQVADLMFSDDFDDAQRIAEAWILSPEWTLIPYDEGQVLGTSTQYATAALRTGPLQHVSVEASLMMSTGAFRFVVRQDDTSSMAYIAEWAADGTVSLYRGAQIMATASAVPLGNGAWHRVKLTVFDNVLRAYVDDVEVIAIQDAGPLGSGTISFAAVELNGAAMFVEHFALWAPAMWPPASAEATDTPPAPLPTAEATATPASLTLLLADDFELPQFDLWSSGPGWIHTSAVWQRGHALLARIPDTLHLTAGAYTNVAVEAQFWLSSGAVEIGVRESEAGGYRVVMDRAGSVTLYRNAEPLETTLVAISEIASNRMRLEAVGNCIRVYVDEAERITVYDDNPLPGGAITFRGHGDNLNFWMDNVQVWVSQDESRVLPQLIVPQRTESLRQMDTTRSFAPQSMAGSVTLGSRAGELSGRMVYVIHPSNDNPAVYVREADGTTRLLIEEAWEPAISPDGERVAVFAPWLSPNTKNFIIDLEPGGACPPTNPCPLLTSETYLRHGEWSPDGTKLVFDEGMIDAVPGIPQQIQEIGGSYPSFAPDGIRIAHKTCSVFVYPYCEQEAIQITNTLTNDSEIFPVTEGTGIVDLDWSPDPENERIAFSVNIRVVNTSSTTTLIMNSDGTDRHIFDGGWDPVWSPDGEQIAWFHYDEVLDTWGIFVASADSSADKQLLVEYGEQPDWGGIVPTPEPTPEPSPTPTLPPGMVTCSTVIETLNDSATVCDTTGCQIVLGSLPNAGSVEMYGRSADNLWYKLRGIGWLADETPASVDGWVAAEELLLVDEFAQRLGCLDGLAAMDDTGATLTPTPVPSGVCTSRPLDSETGAFIRPTPSFGAGTPLIKYGGTLMLAGAYDQDGEWLRVEGYTDPGGNFDGTVVGWAHESMFGGVEPCGDGNAVDNLPIVDASGEVIGDPPTPQPTATPLPPPPTPAFGVGCRVYTAAPAYIRFGPYTYGDATVPLYMIEQGVWVDLYSKTVNGETMNGIPNWYNVGYPSSENPLYYGWMHESLLDANLLQSGCAGLPVVGSALPPTPVPPTPTPSATPPPNWEYYESIFPLPMVGPNEAHPARLSDCEFNTDPSVWSRDINPRGLTGTYPIVLPAPAIITVVDGNYSSGDSYNGGLGNYVAIRIDVADLPLEIQTRLFTHNAPFDAINVTSDAGSTGSIHIGFGHLSSITTELGLDELTKLPAGTQIGISGNTGGERYGIVFPNHLDISVFYTPDEGFRGPHLALPSNLSFPSTPPEIVNGTDFKAFYWLYTVNPSNFGQQVTINPLALWPSLQEGTICSYEG